LTRPRPAALAALDERLKLRLVWALALVLAALAAGQIWGLLRFQPPGLDFLPLWTAGRLAWTDPAHLYDFAAVTRAQTWLLPGFAFLRPYAYPPTTLLALAPFGALPFWTALSLWTGASFAVFAAAGARLAPARTPQALALLIFSPAVVLAALVGQTVVLAAGLAALAIAELERRPRLAGVLLALAAAMKPQAALLAPVALVACGAFEALAAAALAGAALAAASIVCFGLARWPEWLASFAPFQAVIEGVPALMRGVITPAGAAHALGLSGPAALIWRAGFGLFGALLVWRAFRASRDPAIRLAALGAGSLMAAPYAMHYDGVLLVIPAVALAVRLEVPGWLRALAAFAAVSEVTTPDVGFLAVVAFAGLACWEVFPARFRARAAAAPA
jgi:hypothetical protein